MSRLTNYAENALADMARGEGITLPTGWSLGLLSAASDSSFTELTGTDYARVTVPRSLTDWAGTQADGSVLASSGTSHATSNNALVDWGTAGSAWGTAAFVGCFDDPTAGNCWFYLPFPGGSLVINNGDPVSIAAGLLKMTLGLTGGMSNYLANKLIDLLWRDQAYAWPSSLWGKLYTSAPSNAGGGTEVNAPSYARAEIESTTDAWSATDGAGTTTTPSAGSSGRISNNAELAYPSPGAYSWGAITHEGLSDASTLGNLMFWGALASAKTVNAGGRAPSHDPDTLGITFA